MLGLTGTFNSGKVEICPAARQGGRAGTRQSRRITVVLPRCTTADTDRSHTRISVYKTKTSGLSLADQATSIPKGKDQKIWLSAPC